MILFRRVRDCPGRSGCPQGPGDCGEQLGAGGLTNCSLSSAPCVMTAMCVVWVFHVFYRIYLSPTVLLHYSLYHLLLKCSLLMLPTITKCTV